MRRYRITSYMLGRRRFWRVQRIDALLDVDLIQSWESALALVESMRRADLDMLGRAGQALIAREAGR